ncbi:MAG TPA: MAPEG family protein [Burkholderiaceae bacterium]|jgi:uncharacterized MAPEG superfamily protein
MSNLLTLVAYMAIVTWLMLLVASMLRARGWTFPGIMLAFGNRDNLPEPSALAGRAERAARNTLENFVLFAALALAAHAAGATGQRAEMGAEIFFWARLVYIPVYLIGLPFLRTAVYFVSIAGLAMIASVLL